MSPRSNSLGDILMKEYDRKEKNPLVLEKIM